MSAVWLLDIDGVINVLPTGTAPPHDSWDDLVATTGLAAGQEWPIHFSPSLVERVRVVHDDGRAEVRWLTTWEDDAVALARVLGLPDCVVAGYQPVPLAGKRSGWWKLPIARAVADEVDHLVWTDDDLYRHREALDWTRSRPDVFAPRVRAAVGISPSQIRAIEDWLGAARAQPGA